MKQGTNLFKQGQQFHLKRGITAISTKPDQKKGNWYYEVTHHSGTNGFLAGFLINHYDKVDFFPNLYPQNDCISFNLIGDVRTSLEFENQRICLSFVVSEDPYTVGVGIDTKQSLFSP